jgi:predicted Zn-dependent protease
MKYSNPKIPEGINSSEENPLKEFALLATGAFSFLFALVFLFGLILDWSSQFIPFSYEQKIAQPLVNEFFDDDISQINSDSDLVTAYLQKLADDITPFMALEEDVEITLFYVNQDTVNGMATLGGNIFIFRGLLEKLPNENALVMLLAHEIAHVKLRHPLKSLSKGLLISLIFSAVSGASNSDISGLLSGTSQLAFLGFSRSQEQDADNEAILLSQKYYQHTQGANELFKVLLVESKEVNIEPITLFRSHPDVLERINSVRAISDENNWAQDGKLTMVPSHIVERLAQDKLIQKSEGNSKKN